MKKNNISIKGVSKLHSENSKQIIFVLFHIPIHTITIAKASSFKIVIRCGQQSTKESTLSSLI